MTNMYFFLGLMVFSCGIEVAASQSIFTGIGLSAMGIALILHAGSRKEKK